MTHHESHISLGSVLAKGSESRESSSHDLIYRNYRIVLDKSRDIHTPRQIWQNESIHDC